MRFDTVKVLLLLIAFGMISGWTDSGTFYTKYTKQQPSLPKLIRMIALKLVKEYSVSLAEPARQLNVSTITYSDFMIND